MARRQFEDHHAALGPDVQIAGGPGCPLHAVQRKSQAVQDGAEGDLPLRIEQAEGLRRLRLHAQLHRAHAEHQGCAHGQPAAIQPHGRRLGHRLRRRLRRRLARGPAAAVFSSCVVATCSGGRWPIALTAVQTATISPKPTSGAEPSTSQRTQASCAIRNQPAADSSGGTSTAAPTTGGAAIATIVPESGGPRGGGSTLPDGASGMASAGTKAAASTVVLPARKEASPFAAELSAAAGAAWGAPGAGLARGSGGGATAAGSSSAHAADDVRVAGVGGLGLRAADL